MMVTTMMMSSRRALEAAEGAGAPWKTGAGTELALGVVEVD